jgi:hypothetical protein
MPEIMPMKVYKLRLGHNRIPPVSRIEPWVIAVRVDEDTPLPR